MKTTKSDTWAVTTAIVINVIVIIITATIPSTTPTNAAPFFKSNFRLRYSKCLMAKSSYCKIRWIFYWVEISYRKKKDFNDIFLVNQKCLKQSKIILEYFISVFLTLGKYNLKNNQTLCSNVLKIIEANKKTNGSEFAVKTGIIFFNNSIKLVII